MAMSSYLAHLDGKREQSILEHSQNTAALSADFAISALKPLAYILGMLHDIGKYQNSFQKRIRGKNIRVDHSTCGAIEAMTHYQTPVTRLMLALCIAGHHSGLPDTGSKQDDGSTLYGRINRQDQFEDYSVFRREMPELCLDENALAQFIADDCQKDMKCLTDKLAFLTRFCFSCLTDADYLDTEAFYTGTSRRTVRSDFRACLERIDRQLDGFVCKTALQKTRRSLQEQAFSKADRDAEIYLMNMPTGSGKTLCSMKFALMRAIRKGYRHIIYVIPYNSIIDQTVSTFETIFGEDARILRHQSTFSYDDIDAREEVRVELKYAVENWDASIIVTTAVQFFESMNGSKKRQLRKMHNVADSIIIFDEAHLMPTDFLQPCLQAVAFTARYLNSEALFLTATMPDFKALLTQYTLPDMQILDLIDDRRHFTAFQKCRYHDAGLISKEALVVGASTASAALIVVNKRRTAREIYAMLPEDCHKYHLSTYMIAADRLQTIREIKERLAHRDGKPILVVATSLIEAGVDLDFDTVYRELSGLDSILQAGGRCNREGKQATADVYVFELDEAEKSPDKDARSSLAKGIFNRFEQIDTPEAIEAYYQNWYTVNREDLTRHAMHQFSPDFSVLQFKSYGEQFQLIDSKTVSIVVPTDEVSRSWVSQLSFAKSSLGIARRLQPYALSVYSYEFNVLREQGVLDDYGTGIWCLTNLDYYDAETGIQFEGKDYFIV